jgi:ferrous iron transport protein B
LTVPCNNQKVKEEITAAIFQQAEALTSKVVSRSPCENPDWEKKIDDILTSLLWGFPVMFLLLGLIFWITLVGANIPSTLLGKAFSRGEIWLTACCTQTGVPYWVQGLLISGIYKTTTWVIAVMLPPMAIFFPLFTFLEDTGYLPRAAFNLDYFFKKAGTQGKQALTMSMGFGCNAVGVVSCRIIESPRERLIAILTNVFTPCNGRLPTLVLLAGLATTGITSPRLHSLASAALVAGMVVIGIAVTFLISWGLSKTFLKGVPSFFILELPPYRQPHWKKVLVHSLFDRTLVVLSRAVTIAAPAGAITWLLANTSFGNTSLLLLGAQLLQPIGQLLGLDGFILMAFILGLPANEIVLPILLMGYLSSTTMVDVEGLKAISEILHTHGWTPLTAFNMMLFSLLHFPCSTTISTIYKETKSLKWTLMGVVVPTLVAVTACLLTTALHRLLM